MVTEPLVSVVTPFFNTAPYLAECIESVLSQTYSNFAYILMDNCSTDGSTEIAQSYARRDTRIRFIQCSHFVPHVTNYNRALAEISDTCEFCKVVEADNYIFPDCLPLMVEAFRRSESIGLVTSYCLLGDTVLGSGYPYPMRVVPGKEWAMRCLRGNAPFVFGSPTTVMYRSSIVRANPQFYNESALHPDTEKCMELLEHWDLGFVHQILSFLRIENESISTVNRARDKYHLLDSYIIAHRYAPVFLGASEAMSSKKRLKRDYYRFLADAFLRRPDHAFWRYHKAGLNTLGQKLDQPYLALQIGLEVLRKASNPGRTVTRALKALNNKI